MDMEEETSLQTLLKHIGESFPYMGQIQEINLGKERNKKMTTIILVACVALVSLGLISTLYFIWTAKKENECNDEIHG
jgi:hypothetical protein